MTVYRNASYALLIAVVSSLFASASIVAAAVSGGPWTPAIVVCALAAFCLLRLARAGVYVGEKEIRVLNPLRTVRVPWDHVLRFTVKSHKGFTAVGFVELIDGREILVWGIQSRSGTAVARRVPEEVVAALNERLAARRAVPPPPP